MPFDEATKLARADLDICVVLPAVLVAIGDTAAAAQLAKAAPRILTIDDLEEWHAMHVSPRSISVQAALLIGYAHDVSDALLYAPQFFDEAVEALEDRCRESILGLVSPLAGLADRTGR